MVERQSSSPPPSERRVKPRNVLWFPVELYADGEPMGAAVSHDVSATGILILARCRLGTGVPVRLRFPLLPDAAEITGTVVRAGDNRADPDGLWPRELGVEFDEPAEALVERIRELTDKM